MLDPVVMDFEHLDDIVTISGSALKSLGIERSTEEISELFERPKERSWGDWAFPCFTLAKELKKSPAEISRSLGQSLEQEVGNYDWLSEISVAGPYLNFKLSRTEQAKNLVPKILSGEFLEQRRAKKEKVMVEYSQPNTHKAFHVGHTRNASLGDSIVRILEWQGYQVVAANYLGDVGAHIARCLWYYKNFFNGEVPKTHRGEFLGTLYSKAVELLDFSLLTRAPHPGVIAAEVSAFEEHPKNKKWFVAEVSTGRDKFTTVTALGDIKVGAKLAFVPPGVKFNGRLVTEGDKQGVPSQGTIPSCKELGTSDDNESPYIFSGETELGAEVAEILRIPRGFKERSFCFGCNAGKTGGSFKSIKSP